MVSSVPAKRDYMLAHRRHAISDRAWANMEKLLPGPKGYIGRPLTNNRPLINAAFWILRKGSRGGTILLILATGRTSL